MTKETYYTLLVNGEVKRLNEDLQRLQGMAASYMREDNLLTIRCPQKSGGDAQTATLTYDKVKRTWAATR